MDDGDRAVDSHGRAVYDSDRAVDDLAGQHMMVISPPSCCR